MGLGAVALYAATNGALAKAQDIRPFRIQVGDDALSDLAIRLRKTRWIDALKDAEWAYGADLRFMRDLVAYWRDRFDWRAEEERLNAFPQFIADVEGHDIHFIHVKGNGPDPLPLLLTHGWPSSVAEFAKIIPLLTDPAAHGGRAEDAFDIVAPSLPGYGFSARPAQSGMTSERITALLAALMDMLGYRRFAAHGGDIGGGITNRLGRRCSDRVVAIHSMQPALVADRTAPDLSDAERAWLDLVDRWELDEGAYGHQQRTRPQTLAFGLNDSPAGLAAWIIEKWRAWSDCGGDVLSRFTVDELLTNVSIYWFTQTIGSSMRLYYESAHCREADAKDRIEVPARLFLTREAVELCPPEYAARGYADLSYGTAAKGGHFLAAEQPELLAEDIGEYFRRFRTPGVR
ncbi:MAG: alpha/beta fold hydrolase [Alphaproteobacteria bacterium]|nr:alpha/beta fold hydrolase [Alphaproteobacteria bacterium]